MQENMIHISKRLMKNNSGVLGIALFFIVKKHKLWGERLMKTETKQHSHKGKTFNVKITSTAIGDNAINKYADTLAELYKKYSVQQ